MIQPTKQTILNYFGEAGMPLDSSDISAIYQVSEYFIIQIEETLYNCGTDSNEYEIYSLNNHYAECYDSIKAESLNEAITKLKAWVSKEEAKSWFNY